MENFEGIKLAKKWILTCFSFRHMWMYNHAACSKLSLSMRIVRQEYLWDNAAISNGDIWSSKYSLIKFLRTFGPQRSENNSHYKRGSTKPRIDMLWQQELMNAWWYQGEMNSKNLPIIDYLRFVTHLPGTRTGQIWSHLLPVVARDNQWSQPQDPVARLQTRILPGGGLGGYQWYRNQW